MGKTIYFINACEAGIKEELTPEETKRSQALSSAFSTFNLEKVISSPCSKTLAFVQPIAALERLVVQKDKRLVELGGKTRDEEKQEEGQERILEVVKEASFYEKTLIVTHPGILTALLQYYAPLYGLKPWKTLHLTDIFRLDITHQSEQLLRVHPVGEM